MPNIQTAEAKQDKSHAALRWFQRTPSNFSSLKEVWLVDTEGN